MSRTCGECTQCCVVLNVPELSKGRYVACDKLGAAGCTIYDDPNKAPVCSAYQCVWLRDDGKLRENERPDVCGLIFDYAAKRDVALQQFGKPIIVAHECWEGAADGYWGAKVIERLRRKYAVAVVWKDERRMVL